ncbi:MAG TPA: ATP-dependent Clp protease adaptor ClpS [Abditibacteriaceae bacterium]|jgi:ATP-dependent Clp protease adapter protein ClpS
MSTVENAVISQHIPLESIQNSLAPARGEGWRVILYNDDWHGCDEVVAQVQKATSCDLETAVRITLEVDARGRGVCFRGDLEECHRVVKVLREIRLQCEVDED